MASGCDSGVFSIWDLRSLTAPAATFSWHKKQITAIAWHPFESSMLVTSGGDEQSCIWDLALEADGEDLAAGDLSVPAQLLFVHQGQHSVKDVQWHPFAKGVLCSTSFDGFNVFKTINS